MCRHAVYYLHATHDLFAVLSPTLTLAALQHVPHAAIALLVDPCYLLTK